MNVKSLTQGVQGQVSTWSIGRTHVGTKQNPRDYGTKEDVTVTESLWRGGGYKQDGLGTSAVLEPKSQVRALGLEEEIQSLKQEEPKSQVRALGLEGGLDGVGQGSPKVAEGV